jgi:hypothetical protein
MPIGLQRRKYEGDIADLLEEGRTDFAAALAITLYFDGPRDRFADGVAACWEEFVQRSADRLTWYADEELGKWRRVSPERLRRPTDRLKSSKAMPFYAWTAVSGRQFEDASDVTFNATVRDGAGGYLSYLRATFPTGNDIEEFITTAQRWCERVPFLHGYGGLTVNQSPHEPQPNSGMLLQIAERFPGFEIDDCGGTILVAQDFIKGVNWLTFLGPSFVDRLGDGFSPAVSIHRFITGGLIIRAGRVPVRGDAGDDLEPYREVARVLRLICLTTHPPLGPAEFGSFGSEKTDRWLRRFES